MDGLRIATDRVPDRVRRIMEKVSSSHLVRFGRMLAKQTI